MFYKIREVTPLDNYLLSVRFCIGITKIYDVKQLFDWKDVFAELKKDNLFYEAKVDKGGLGVIWNDEIDISCNELWCKGRYIKTAFDGLIAFTDAIEMWGLNESTLRKAVSYKKLVNGIDVSKFGNQWVVTFSAMEREYSKYINDDEDKLKIIKEVKKLLEK